MNFKVVFQIGLLICAIVNARFVYPAEQVIPFMPLQEGATWSYQGKATWITTSIVNSRHVNQLHKSDIHWTTRVTKKISGSGTIAAVLVGFPLALSPDEPNEQPGYAVIVETKTGIFVQSTESEERGEFIARKAVAGGDPGDQILRLPIRTGECIGGDSAASSKEYCWLVRQRVVEPHGLGWHIEYYTLPDEQSAVVVAGIGITRFSYEHHGSRIATSVHLEKFEKDVGKNY